jgi:PilZ domain
MQNQIASSPDLQLLHEPRWCAAASCSANAAIDFAGRSLCLEHFMPACVAEIESRNECLRNLPFDPEATAALKTLIATSARQAEALAANALTQRAEELTEQSAADARFTHAQMKTSVLDFLLRLSQLSQRIRRSPRTASSISVWLRREDPHQTWHEETWTVSVSRHGAALLCRRPVEKGGKVVLCRKDKGARAEAQVVYSLRDSEGRKQIGIQFNEPINFWD